jgi:ParB/RepB/Spo0J family partition protein
MGGESLIYIAMELIVPSPHNPRRIRKDDPAVRELAESIKGHGLLQPVVVRDTSFDGPLGHSVRYELLAGRRRFEAHKLLGAESILAIVRDLSDQDAIEVTVLENLQRENLSPIEEARGVASMIQGGHALDAIAAKMGKSRAWVARRAAVKNLMRELVALAEEHDWSVWRIDALGRLPRVTQEHLRRWFETDEYYLEPDRDGAVANKIADLLRTLKTMPWRKADDGTLCPEAGPCADCLKRSSVHPDLFDEPGEDTGKAGADTCLDGDCYDRKMAAWIERKEADLRAKHEGLVLVSSMSSYMMKDEAKKRGAMAEYDYDRAKSKSEKGARPALMVDGAQAGTLVWIKNGLDSSGRRGTTQTAGNANATATERLAAKREMLANRRNAWVIEQVAAALGESAGPRDAKSLVRDMFVEKPLMLMALAVALGTSVRQSYPNAVCWEDAERLFKGDPVDLIRMLWLKVADVLQERIKIYGAQQCAPAYKEAMEIRELLSMESEEVLQARAAMEIPEPKAWAKIEAEAAADADQAADRKE